MTKLNNFFWANISGVYITKTKISKTFSISLSKNGEISPGKKRKKKKRKTLPGT
jgi:hypothetical protein